MIDHSFQPRQPQRTDLALDLSSAPSVIYIYGQTGAGKSYVTDLIGELSDRHVYDADQDLTPEMLDAIENNETFTPEMRDRFFAKIAENILDLQKHHKELVVVQATYRLKHRDYLQSKIPDMDMICITAPEEVINERLRARGDAITPDYAARMRAHFEPPRPGDKVLVNDAKDDRIVSQLNAFYSQQAEWLQFCAPRWHH